MKISDQQKEEIYRDYQPKVFGFLISRINRVQEAEDLTADVFVKVYEKLDRFDEKKASLSTWIYTITQNTLIDYYRTRKVHEELPEVLRDTESSVEEEVCNNEMLEALAKGLKSLEERERDIVILRFYSGKTLIEIAEKMGISYAYVKVLQNKAFKKLRVFLENK